MPGRLPHHPRIASFPAPMKRLRILHIASEAFPFVKTGGLADVIGSLSRALVQDGCDARVVLPGYQSALAEAERLGLAWHQGHLAIEAGGIEHRLGVGEVVLDGCRFYLLACDELYGRSGIYGPMPTQDYEDNARRFSVFAKAALALPGFLSWRPQIVHAHDWQTGLVPALLQRGFIRDLPASRSVFTIHNIAYQGAFWHWDMKLTGLDWALYNPLHLEHFGRLNFLKSGIVFADRLTTVSRRYAHEIQEEDHGFGLDAVVRLNAYKLTGITNGIDTGVWDPARDPHLVDNYEASDLTGKRACKRALQAELDLPQRDDVCLVGCVGRLVEQKGIDLAIEVVEPYLIDDRMQLVVLGTGHPALEYALRVLQGRHPGSACFWHGFNEGLGHRIEAGSDLFLMPSRFEPCGLNQMYSLRYGTLPLVRYTGGLADTVRDISVEDGNGFTFGPMDYGHFSAALDRALGLYAHHPERWRQAMQVAMAEDNSWEQAAARYRAYYRELIDA